MATWVVSRKYKKYKNLKNSDSIVLYCIYLDYFFFFLGWNVGERFIQENAHSNRYSLNDLQNVDGTRVLTRMINNKNFHVYLPLVLLFLFFF